jgi:hypothetical protein
VSSAQRGPLIAGTWLVGLGVVFLIRQALDIPWSEAWPLFVILVGVASGVSVLLRGLRGVPGLWDLTWPVAWIVVGVALLLSTTGRLGRGPVDLVAEYWPWVLVVLGIWFVIGAFLPGGAPTESLAIGLDGASEANVRIQFGAGELATRRAAPGNLVDGEFIGGVIHRREGAGSVRLEQDTSFGLPWLDHRSSWSVGLTGEVPLDLRLDTGAARARLDLSDLRVRRLEIHSGASDTHVRLPRAAGATTVKAETGAASLTIEIPEGVAARIRSRMGLGSSQVDLERFPRAGEGYESADYATAANRADIDISGGVGSFKIVGGA